MGSATSERNDQAASFMLWMRIVAGSFGAVVAALAFFTDPHDFLQWFSLLSMALFLLFLKFPQPNESFQEYMVKPRAMITFASMVGVLVSSIWWLAEHFGKR